MNLFIFDFDGTITKEDITDLILGIPNEDRVWEIEEQWQNGKITSYECMKAQAEFLRGITTKRIYQQLKQHSHLDPCFPRLIQFLKATGFRTFVLSEGYDLPIRFHEVQRHVEEVHSSKLLVEEGRLTGELKVQNEKLWNYNRECIGCCICKVDFLRQLGQRFNVKRSFAVGDGRSDECLFQYVDVSFSLNPKYKATYHVGDLCEVLQILNKTFGC